MNMRARVQTSFARRASGWRIWGVPMALAVLSAFAADVAAQGLAPLGVREPLEAPCGYGEVLTGIFIANDGYTFIDASPQCAKAANPGLKVHAAPERWLGSDTAAEERWPVDNPACPGTAPVVLSIRVDTLVNSSSEIKNFRFQRLLISCGVDASHPSLEQYGGQASTIGGGDWEQGTGTQFCPAGQVAVGIHGRMQSAYGLDEIGLICGDPQTGYDNPLELRGDQPIDRNAAARRAVLGQPVLDSHAIVIKPVSGTSSRLGRLAIPASPAAAGAAVPPVVPPPPVAPPADPGRLFAPPAFGDGAQLWACTNAVEAKKKGIACPGLKAGKSFCRAQGFSGALQPRADGAPDLAIAATQPGTPVHAVNGDACGAANCIVVVRLHCAP